MNKQQKNNDLDPIIEAKLEQVSLNIERYGNRQIFLLEKILEELREITKNIKRSLNG